MIKPQAIERLDQAFSELGFEEVVDEAFEQIESHPEVKKLELRLMNGSWLCTVMGGVFFSLGAVAHLFYSHKNHLAILGLISFMHIPCGLTVYIAVRKKNRYLLLVSAALNSAWIFCAVCLTLVCIFLLEDGDLKEEFNQEIVFHVGLVFYLPLALFTAKAHFSLVRTLCFMKGKVGGSKSGLNTSSTVENKDGKAQDDSNKEDGDKDKEKGKEKENEDKDSKLSGGIDFKSRLARSSKSLLALRSNHKL